MAFSFGDSFDLYAAVGDMVNGYWDSGAGSPTFVAGRFSGSQAMSMLTGATVYLTKSSAVNDAVHHVVCSFRQTQAISGTTLGAYFELFDGATGQCSIVFKSNGDILLTSGGPAGTVLDTYTGAVAANNTWYAFEFEVAINSTTGSWAVRKNGNNVNDHSLGSLNTRGGTTNNYANKLSLGMSAGVNAQQIDDLFWQSGAATGTWLGDIRCYARMPASDQSVVFSKSPLSVTVNPGLVMSSTPAIASGVARYVLFTASVAGSITAATVSLGAGYTGNLKCSIFAGSGTQPTTVLGSATVLVNPVTGVNTITFVTPVPVVSGTTYFIGFDSDTSSGAWNTDSSTQGQASTTAYASFPIASPTMTVNQTRVGYTVTISYTSNATLVNEAQQDALTSYVYDSNPGDADFYGIGSIASTPATVIATTVRVYAQKSDAGTRTMTVQLKSGATTVASPTLVLTTSGFVWAWRMDLTDPNTSVAWTPAAVNNAQVGPKVIA